jgi:hypothetical protein
MVAVQTSRRAAVVEGIQTGSGLMIRYSCDMCKRDLDAETDLRYVVKMEVFAALCPAASEEEDDDRDHLEQIQNMLERLDSGENDQLNEEVYQQMRFDLCPECRKKFIQDPLGREIAKVFGFSEN